MSRSGIRHYDVLIITIVVYDSLHARPRVLYVVEIPPQIAVLDDAGEIWLHSRVNLIYWPTAGVDHRSSGSVEVEAEFGISSVHFCGVGVAAVQFDVVHVPGRESVGVDLQVPQNSGVTGTSIVSEVFVYSEF